MKISDLWRSTTLRAAVVYGIGGIGFAVGNLLLARGLPSEQYAIVVLVLAISRLSYGVGPMGMATIVNRFVLRDRRGVLQRVLVSSSVVAVALTGIATALYSLTATMAAILLIFCIAISVNRVASAIYQSRKMFAVSLSLLQWHNLFLGLVGLGSLLAGVNGAGPICGILALSYVGSAVLGWQALLRETQAAGPHSLDDVPWRESIALVFLGAASILLTQLERLTIPVFLTTEALATFAVVATVVGSAYRVLQMGVGFTLLPRLRSAPTVEARRKTLRAEAGILLAASLVGSLAVWIMAVPIVEWFVASKYQVEGSLVLALMIAGLTKVAASFGEASVTSVATSEQLGLLSVNAVLAAIIAVVGAYMGSRWGIEGVVYGVSVGWAYLALASLGLSIRYQYFKAGPATA